MSKLVHTNLWIHPIRNMCTTCVSLCQMLSTIVCVLTLGRDRRKGSKGVDGRYQLLPKKFDERRYDNYLMQYATLLYGWGILTVRNEISKRLVYGIPGAGAEIVTLVRVPWACNICLLFAATLVPNPFLNHSQLNAVRSMVFWRQ